MLPVAPTSFQECNEKNADQGEDSFDWAGHYSECQSVSVVFIPGLDVESEKGAEQGEDGVPGLAKVRGCSEEEDFETGIARVDT